MKIVIYTIKDAEQWYDASSLGAREAELKSILTNHELKMWFSELWLPNQQAVFVRLKGRTLDIPAEASDSPDANWAKDTIQFPRFIEEAQAAGAFTDDVIDRMSASMDLTREQVQELMDRAASTWEMIKAAIPSLRPRKEQPHGA